MTRHQYNNYKSILKQILDYAVDVGIIDRSPLSDIKINTRLLKQEVKGKDEKQVFSKPEFDQFKTKAWAEFKDKKHPLHTLIPLACLFQFYTGLRIGEVVALQWSDVSEDHITVRHFYRWATKEIVEHTKGTFGDREILLTAEAKEIIKACSITQKGRHVKTRFVFSMTKEPVPYDDIRDKFRTYCRILGCENKSSHKARKTFISSLIDAGMNINTVRRLAGHVDERTTLQNYVFDRSSTEEKLDKMEKALK